MVANVLVMAGGTGGHVFPALAVAECLRARGMSVHWLGTRRGIESRVVPAAGFPIHFIEISGLRGKRMGDLLMAPLRVLRALWQSLRVMRALSPGVVLGMGGFVAGPGGIAAWLMRRPVVIHEQNAVAGTTNRLLAHVASAVLSGYPQVRYLPRAQWTGNPVRAAIAQVPAPAERWQTSRSRLNLLVLGGSLGAQAINQTVPAALALLPATSRPAVRHQCGRDHEQTTRALYSDQAVIAEVVPFIDDMARAYAWADLVICRAGALTIAELAAVGVGALIVPLPQAIDDHQTANARWFCDAGAGRLLPQKSLTPSALSALLASLMDDRAMLLDWAEAARGMGRPDATEAVARRCLEVAHD